MSWARPGPAPEEAARQLAALVRECAGTGVARQVLLLRLSTLPRELAQPHHRRLAHEALEPLAGADRARLFVLPGGDAAMVWRGPAPGQLAASLARLRHLFSGSDDGGPALEAVALHLGLPEDEAVLLGYLEAASRPAPALEPAAAPRTPLDRAALAALEAALAQADLSRFARRRPVCAALAGGWRLAWERRRFCLVELAEALAPARDLTGEPWLFRRLTRVLDQRMMALLAAPRELEGAPPFSLTLNVASVLSPAFLRFDAALPARLRGRVVVEMRPEDVMADTGAYLFARDFAQARGFRVLLGPLDATLAGMFLPDAAGADYLRLMWPGAAAAPDLSVLGHPPGRVVLAGAAPGGVAEPGALDWARRQGVGLVEAPLAAPRVAGLAAG